MIFCVIDSYKQSGRCTVRARTWFLSLLSTVDRQHHAILAPVVDFRHCPLLLYQPAKHMTKTRPCNLQRFFSNMKKENFIGNFLIFFLFLLQNIDCGYSLEPPHLIFAQNIDCGYTLEPPRVPTIYVLEQK